MASFWCLRHHRLCPGCGRQAHQPLPHARFQGKEGKGTPPGLLLLPRTQDQLHDLPTRDAESCSLRSKLCARQDALWVSSLGPVLSVMVKDPGGIQSCQNGSVPRTSVLLVLDPLESCHAEELGEQPWECSVVGAWLHQEGNRPCPSPKLECDLESVSVGRRAGLPPVVALGVWAQVLQCGSTHHCLCIQPPPSGKPPESHSSGCLLGLLQAMARAVSHASCCAWHRMESSGPLAG